MNLDYEKLIDEIISRLKTEADVSDFKKNRKVSPFVTLLSQLHSVPRAKAPMADLMRVKNQILDRISVPVMQEQKSGFFNLFSLPQFFRMGATVLGTLLIVISLTLGTAVAALQSVPGQAIYPLKKVVENIQLKLTPENDKANLQIKFANNRVDELTQVLQQQQDGQISAQTAQKIVASTVSDLQKTTKAAAKATVQQPKNTIVNKLADLSAKLQIASIKTEGEVKIELEKAFQNTQASKQEAIKNIQDAGLEVEEQPADTKDSVQASGKLTAVSSTTLSIGTAKFLITKDTKYVNITQAELDVELVVDIQGIIKDNKTYAQTVTLISDTKIERQETDTKTEAPSAL